MLIIHYRQLSCLLGGIIMTINQEISQMKRRFTELYNEKDWFISIDNSHIQAKAYYVRQLAEEEGLHVASEPFFTDDGSPFNTEISIVLNGVKWLGLE